MNRVFIVTMQRYGDYNYVIGVYSNLAKATIEALEYRMLIDNKYEPLIQECIVDSDTKILQVSLATAIEYTKILYPEKFDDKNNLIGS